MNVTRCKRCRGVIFLVDSAATSRPVAVDAVPHADGNVALTAAGAVFLAEDQVEMGRMLGSRRYCRHSSTCPRAKKRTGPTKRDQPPRSEDA
jgi:hypothetical protein